MPNPVREVLARVTYQMQFRYGPFVFDTGEERLEVTTKNATAVIVRVTTMGCSMISEDVVAIVGSADHKTHGTSEMLNLREFIAQDGALSLGRNL